MNKNEIGTVEKAVKAKRGSNGTVIIFCPGCKCHHDLNVYKRRHNGSKWTFNGNYERPTFHPSLVVKTGFHADSKATGDLQWLKENSSICHSWIRDGKIQYLTDTTHSLAGKTVELPDLIR